MEAAPEPNTNPPARQPRITIRAVFEALAWARTGISVYLLVGGHETAVPAVKTIAETAVRFVLDVVSA